MATRTIFPNNIDKERMPGTAAMVRKAVLCHVLDGDTGEEVLGRGMTLTPLTLLIEYGDGRAEIVQSQPSYKFRGKIYEERLTAIPLSRTALNALIDELVEISAPPAKVRKESTGRPVVYGEKWAAEVQRLRAEGTSIRGIAATLGMSTATVQKLLKKM